jgi:prolipoprotein diacylglyceryltransferase
MLALPFPNIDPVAFEFGPLVVRWYALAYIVGLILGWKYTAWLNRRPAGLVPQAALDDFLAWAVIGIVLGGRIGYVLFRSPSSSCGAAACRSMAAWPASSSPCCCSPASASSRFSP